MSCILCHITDLSDCLSVWLWMNLYNHPDLPTLELNLIYFKLNLCFQTASHDLSFSPWLKIDLEGKPV